MRKLDGKFLSYDSAGPISILANSHYYMIWAKAFGLTTLRVTCALAAPFTIDIMPEGTLRALAEETRLDSMMVANGGDWEETLREFTAAGIDIDALAERLQDEGTKSFAKSWDSLMAVIASKREPQAKAA